MNKNHFKIQSNRVKIIVFVVFSLIMSQAVAQFKITKYNISTGGGVIANQNYQITGSVGQSEASITSSGGNYVLNSGFWTPGIDNDLIYKNGFE